MSHGDRTRPWAFFNTSGAKPALFGIEDDGGFPFYRVGHHDIGRTHLDTEVAAIAYLRVEFLPFIGSHRVGRHIYLFTHQGSPFSKITKLVLPLDGEGLGWGWSSDKHVPSEPFVLRQAQDERQIEGLRMIHGELVEPFPLTPALSRQGRGDHVAPIT
jgi:hypothetical protein